ncbi:MAG: alcohol dehydrogenase [Rhizobiales bacterium 17-65-6]|nr:MAG: alcohol dehydrogenase [Azorhizobium sp. 32-67-21]OYZ97974.1 MAG: alcohol dehydrogenase [Rhizobiales bacterium 17-65-6]
MTALDFSTTPRLILREEATGALPDLFRQAGARHVAVVTDAGLVRAGLVEPVVAQLRAAGLAVTVHDAVVADPPEPVIEAAVARLQAAKVDAVLGLGGGSAMDTAKLVAYLLRSPAPLAELYGIGLAQGQRLPLILTPTTAGTGSEVTPISIVTTRGDEKKGVVSARLLPDVAVLDPLLTLGLPPEVTAATGIDAMVHAIEAFTSARLKNPMSDVLAKQALTLLSANLPKVLADGGNVAARGDMLLGSCLAGMAFANAPVAAVHALAYPLGGRYHIPHGLSNALMLLPVLRFNLSAAAPLYAELAPCVGAPTADADAFLAAIAALVAGCAMPKRLHELKVTRESLPQLARDAMQQQRLLINNPVPLTEADALRLYEDAY